MPLHELSFLCFHREKALFIIAGLITLCTPPSHAYNNRKKEATVGMEITQGILAPKTSYRTPYTIFRSTIAGPVMMIAAGIHGNETASIKAAQNLIAKLKTGKMGLRQGDRVRTGPWRPVVARTGCRCPGGQGHRVAGP